MAAAMALDVPWNFHRLAETFWPGPLTIVLDASHQVPLKVTANTKRVALRWPKNEVVAGLIREFGGPVTGTSANLSGHPFCSTAEEGVGPVGERVAVVDGYGDTKGWPPFAYLGF